MSIDTLSTRDQSVLDEGPSTMESFSTDLLPSITAEGISAHTELNDALSKHLNNPEDQSVLQDIIAGAHNLAAQILPKNICDQLDLEATVPDMAGYYHPPTVEEALLLGSAYDATQDEITLDALAASIREIPINQKSDEVKVDLLTKAFKKVVTEEDTNSFTATYVKAASETDGLVEIDTAANTNVYMDMSPNAPTEAELGSMDDPKFDERMERLVRPIGAAFLRAVTGEDNKTAIPAIHFR